MVTLNKQSLVENLNQKYLYNLKSSKEYEQMIKDENLSKTSTRYKELEKQSYQYRCAARDFWNLIQNIESGSFDSK